jgi:hypothetical protein
MRNVAVELAELALGRGIDVNVAWEKERDPVIAVEAVT